MRRPAAAGRTSIGTLITGLTVFLLTPFVEVIGSHPLWTGPTIPVLGRLDVTTEELANGLFQALRLVAVGLAFAVYALLLDHDRLLASAGWARRSTVAVALATRLVPLLERDAPRSAPGASRSRRRAERDASALAAPRRVARARARPRGGDGGARLRPARDARGRRAAPWTWLDLLALAASVLIVVVGAMWL